LITEAGVQHAAPLTVIADGSHEQPHAGFLFGEHRLDGRADSASLPFERKTAPSIAHQWNRARPPVQTVPQTVHLWKIRRVSFVFMPKRLSRGI